MQGYWSELRSYICRSEVGTQVGTALLPESELGLIRTGLEDTREAMEEFWQKAMGSSKLVT